MRDNKGKRIEGIKYLQVLNLDEYLNFSSHFLFLIPSSPLLKKRRQYLDKMNLSVKKAKEAFKEKIGKTKKKVLSFSEKTSLPYFFNSLIRRKLKRIFIF